LNTKVSVTDIVHVVPSRQKRGSSMVADIF
jgi:hypothetical protein